MEYKSLGELCTITSSKRIFAEQYVDEGVPFYRSKEIIEKNANQDISLELFISEEVYNSIKERFGVPQEGDLLMTSVGTIGIPYVVKKERFYFKDGNLTWMKDFSEEINSQYLYYWFSSKFGKQSLVLKAIGSSQPALTIDILKKYKLLLPDRKQQDKIVMVMSQYDLAIENNNKRIKILEQMAENLYKEWFVRFRFPGHEDVEFEGGIPKGWEVCKVKELVTRLPFGNLYKANDVEKEGKVIVIDQSTDEYVGFHCDEPSHMASIDEPIALFGDHSCKYVLMIEPFSLSENVIPYIANKGIKTTYLFYTLYGIIETTEYKRHWSEFVSKKVLLAPADLQVRFVELVNKHLELIRKIKFQNRNLTKQRDLLLPRLMSGKLEVK